MCLGWACEGPSPPPSKPLVAGIGWVVAAVSGGVIALIGGAICLACRGCNTCESCNNLSCVRAGFICCRRRQNTEQLRDGLHGDARVSLGSTIPETLPEEAEDAVATIDEVIAEARRVATEKHHRERDERVGLLAGPKLHASAPSDDSRRRTNV